MRMKSTYVTGSVAAGAAVLAILVAPSAVAAGSAPGACSNPGGLTTHCQTNGSSQVFAAPNPYVGNSTVGLFGPFFNQNRGLGGAAAIGAAAGGR